MFKLKGFFASSSNFVKFLVALLVPLFFLCFTSAVLAVVLKVTGVEEASVGAELAVQFVSSIITFILGGGLAAYLIFDEPKEELKLSSAGKGKIEGGAEWFEQAAHLEKMCAGKTLDEVKAMMGEDTYATGDLATAGCTMAIGDMIKAATAATK